MFGAYFVSGTYKGASLHIEVTANCKEQSERDSNLVKIKAGYNGLGVKASGEFGYEDEELTKEVNKMITVTGYL